MELTDKTIEIIRTIKQVGHTVKKSFHKQYKDMNITGPQGMLIGTLAHCGEMKISDLSEKLGLSNSTVSGIIDRLEKQNIVERIRSEEDRRVIFVKMTDEFRKNSDARFKEIEKYIADKISKASPEELDKVLEGLNILKRILE